MEFASTLIKNDIQLDFQRAMDVEWYSKTVSLGMKSIYVKEWLRSYFNWNHLGEE